MASLTWWAWVWASSGSWWWIEKPDVLQPMGLQRVRHDWLTEMNWIAKGKDSEKESVYLSLYIVWCVCVCVCARARAHARLVCLTLQPHRLVAYQALLSVEFFRQEYWSGFPFPSPEDFPDPGIESGSPVLQADSLPTELLGKPYICIYIYIYMCVCVCVHT